MPAFINFPFISKLQIVGISLFPFIIICKPELKNHKTFINHESIHLRQQLELLILPFYIWYILEYLILRLKYNHKTAYLNIVFEKEAYQKEKDLDYLKKRKFWNFTNFYGK
ncbi:hypothetical protein [Nonlabens antarcticus]|uniref:hypothetical protein n=1 Tax=Nonlabens antarcticus TaxID=392714 RepID=UPI001891BB04|nr:hypothetical protein [Nonlabens antarcticus]